MVAQCGWLDAKIPIWEKIINHRHEVSEIPKINFIKEKVIEKIGIIPIFYFILFYGQKDHYGAQRNLEKAFLLIFQLLYGYSGRKMNEMLGCSSYNIIYNDLWSRNYDLVDQWVNNSLENMFLNQKIRILSALLNNPKNFKHITLM